MGFTEQRIVSKTCVNCKKGGKGGKMAKFKRTENYRGLTCLTYNNIHME